MIKLNGIDFENSVIGNNPKFGYSNEYREYITISGKIRKDYKGQRFNANITFGYLTAIQVTDLYTILESQTTNGYVSAEISTANGDFTGNVFVTISNSQSRYAKINDAWVWTNWNIILEGDELV